ncbi:phenylacetate--CoA ligase PaaK [Halococcus saccharolyticus]|uniref:Phenylacetate--CoA ligase n=1 Tax=Halococcus saccharolyticus DSM 5350 TaxID=1227455 RepID=M0MQ44_9EURY|nr:phenylacetate--CoA ligase PaaK [Halococcus saccharolyticus]EMA47842.1 phenylacetate--CoA ligase [Halococcus saccharolyticus DSM 5350]
MVEATTGTDSRHELTALQDERLVETVRHAYENVPFYREAMDDAGVAPDDIEGIADIQKLPMTTKEDFRTEYPDGLFAVDDSEVRRIHASSGTTGKPKIVAYTESDLGRWADVMARSLATAGVEPGDTVQNAYGYGLFTGGLGFHDGIEELGATVIPMGGGDSARQLSMLEDLESDALACTPSYCLYLADFAADRGVDPHELPVSTVVIGAEPFTDPMREEIETALDVTAIDIYGLSEIIGPGVAVECAEVQEGLHVWEDHFYPEIVDPATGEPLPPDEEGELVLTSLTKEALPVFRYRTGDITTLYEDECDCGRTAVRMGNVTGRTDDLLIVRGVNVYASQIEEVMLDIDGIAPHYRLDLRRDGSLDTMDVTAERHAEADASADELRAEIEGRLGEQLDVSPDEIDVVEPGEIERTEVGKVKRVFDHR